MTVTTPVPTDGTVIESDWGAAVYADLSDLDGRVSTVETQTGQLVTLGVVGGKYWEAGSASFGDGVTNEVALTGFNSGAIALTGGRRYEIRAKLNIVRSATGGIDLHIKDTNASGTSRGFRHETITGQEDCTVEVTGRYNCASNTTKTFCVTANTTGSGSLNATRDSEQQVYIEVIDIGATNKMTAP